MNDMSKILLTGSDGYLGSLAVPALEAAGFQVTGLDTGFYRSGCLYHARGNQPATIVKDIREVTAEDLQGHEAIVHMAELSNDPLGELDPDITYEINHKGTMHLAETAKAAGIGRFVYMSSCSVYGVVADAEVDETTEPNPQTAYADCKVRCEQDLATLADESFTTCYLRNATAFGASPRQRFDVVLNNLCGLAWTTGIIKMISDGSPWRPLVHGLDIAQAIRHCLEAPSEAIHNEVFNVGSNEQNYRIREIAELVGKVFPDCEVQLGDLGGDNRSYRVRFDKIQEHLPGFSCEWDAEKGVRQFHELFQQIEMTEEDFNDRAFTRLKQLEYLIATDQIDQRFFWKTSL